jgi:hypothetical protein
MVAVTLVCWSDGFDLTREFTRIKDAGMGAGSVPVFGLAPRARQPLPPDAPVHVLVTCPRDHLSNVFLSNVLEADHAGNEPVRGVPMVSAYDEQVLLTKQLTPDQSLTRANDSAKWVIQTVSVVATILGGFGAVAGLSTQSSRHPALIVWTVALAGAAVVCGVIGLLPSLREINVNKSADVVSYYQRVIWWRGSWSIAASIALLVAIVTAIVTVTGYANGPVLTTPTLSAGWDGSGASPVISADATVTHAKSGTGVDLTIEVPAASGSSKPTVLASATGTIGRNGTTEVVLTFVPSPATGMFEAVLRDESGATLASVLLSQPPSFAAPAASATPAG